MTLLFAIENYLYFIVLLLFSNIILGCRLRKNTVSASVLILLSTLILYFVISKSFLRYCELFLSFIIPLVGAKILVKSIKITQLIYMLFLLYFSNALFAGCILFFLPNYLVVEISVEFSAHIFMLIISIILCYTRLSDKIRLIINWTSATIKVLILFVIILCTLIICWVYTVFDSPAVLESSRFINLGCFSLVGLVILLCTAFPILVLNSVANTYFKKLTQNYEEQIKIQAEHYAALSKANFELRRFRHDFKNISLGVKELIAEGKQTEALNILESAKENVYSTTDSMLRFDTGNGIVDALLSDKQRTSALSNIKIQFQGAVPPEGISATELCVIFGNTVDNAIEACEKIGMGTEKIIDIKCKCVSGFMFLNITNPVNEPVIIKNNTIQTTKSDKSLHGFGLYSLEKTVNSHDGKIELLCNNNEFSVNISMLINN